MAQEMRRGHLGGVGTLVVSCWFNLRVLFWHIQILKGRLFRPAISYNSWWWCREVLWKPVWLYECSPREGWRQRGSKQYQAYTQGQKGN